MNQRIFPLGDNSVTVEFGSEISVALNDQVRRTTDFFRRQPFAGLLETVPAYASVTFFYDVRIVRKTFPGFATAFEAVRNLAENALENLPASRENHSRTIKIPVCFDAEFTPDLEFVAAQNDLSIDEAIEIFLSRAYRVFMLGFLPGFAYMGEVDERIAAPRKPNPRLKIPAGSVGIAGRQTGIYPLESPGGWQIIGKTSQQLFTPQAAQPTFLQAGETVEFYRAGREIFADG